MYAGIIDEKSIAIWPCMDHVYLDDRQRDVKDIVSDCALIFELNADFNSLKNNVKSLWISSHINVDFKGSKIVPQYMNVSLKLLNGDILHPTLKNVTLSKRNVNVLKYTNVEKIQFDVSYIVNNVDYCESKNNLYRIPLTPIAVIGDVAAGGIIVATFPIWIPILFGIGSGIKIPL